MYASPPANKVQQIHSVVAQCGFCQTADAFTIQKTIDPFHFTAIARLDDMGIAPFLISSSVILSCAQRLMRKICSHCKEPVTYPPKMYEDLGIDPGAFAGVQLHRGRGCDRCKNSGYAGRMAIIEAMTVTDSIRKLIIARANTREVGKLAVSQGMHTLRMVALDRVREGLSTLEQTLVITSAH